MPIEQVIGLINGILLIVLGYVAKTLAEMRKTLQALERVAAADLVWRVEFTKTVDRHYTDDQREFQNIWAAIDQIRGFKPRQHTG